MLLNETITIMSLPKELTTITPTSKFLAVILFVSLPVVGFLVGMRHQQIVSSPTIITSYPTPTIDDTVYTEATQSANWKTYTSEEYGYSIKYPEFLTYNSRTDESFNGICKSTSDTWKGVQYTIAIVISKEGQCSGLEFNIRPKPEETIALLNQNVKQLTAMDESLIHIGPVKNKSRDYMLIYRSSVNNKPDSTIFYQILSTFRFTDQ